MKTRCVSLSALVVALVCGAVALGPATLAAGEKSLPAGPQVFVYPHKLNRQDKLQDGKSAIEISAETTLVWVDLAPDARFAHPTEYILISVAGTRVVPGQWWPVLNGQDLFRDGKTYQVEFPIRPVSLEPGKIAPAQADRDRLRGMQAAVADLLAGKLKIKSPAVPAAAWFETYVELLRTECGIEWETVADESAKAASERQGYSAVMLLEMEHRFGKDFLATLQKQAEERYRGSLTK